MIHESLLTIVSIRGISTKGSVGGYDSESEVGRLMNHDSLIAALHNACWVLFANAKTYLIIYSQGSVHKLWEVGKYCFFDRRKV